MVHTTQSVERVAIFSSKFVTMALAGFFLILSQSSAHAQWATNGNNINNTNSGNVGVGTTTPGYKLDVAGSVNAAGALCLQGDCKFTWASVATPSQWTTGIGGTSIYYSSGNVGIGTSFTNQKLSVQGMFGLHPQAFVAPTGRGLFMFHGGSAGSIYAFNYPSASADPISISASNLDFNTYIGSTANPRLSIANGGNVGIGTTTPSYQLDVVSGNQWAARFKKTDASNGGIIIDAATGFNPNVAMAVNGTVKWYMNSNGSNSDTLQFWESTGANPRFTLTQAGSVGIGTPGPGYRLDVQGGQINSSGGLCIAGDCKTAWSQVGGTSQWTTSGANIYYNSGNVGIGTTTPGSRLDVGAGSAARGTYTDLLVGHGGNNAQLELFGPTKSVAITNDETMNGLVFYTNGPSFNPSLFLANSGNIGIGTTSPGEFVHIRKDQNAPTHLVVENATASALAYADLQVKNNLGHFAQLGIYSSSTTTAGALAAGNAFAYTSSPAMVVMANNAAGVIKFATGGVNERARIDASGNLGIGTAAPSEKLEVAGNLKLTGTGNIDAAGTITGGTINAKYQDVAEWVESSQALSAGTVVVLDHTRLNQVIASSQAYDTRVAGVISLQPGITLGEHSAGKVLVATTGRVKVKVDASNGPIEVGDLLVTSDKEGVAKKSEPLNLGGVQIHRPGTLIGKALEPLEKGTGEILVLLSLQ